MVIVLQSISYELSIITVILKARGIHRHLEDTEIRIVSACDYTMI